MRNPTRGPLIILSVCFGLLGVVFIFGGVSALVRVASEPEPLRISVANYLQTRPTNRWLELTDCSICMSGAVGHRQIIDGALRDAAIPVFAAGQSTGPVQVVLSMPGNQVVGARGTETGQTVTGMVRSGILYTGLDRDLQAAAKWTLADDYIILDRDKSPSAAMGIGGLAAGLICLASVARTLFLLSNPPPSPMRLRPAWHDIGMGSRNGNGVGSRHQGDFRSLSRRIINSIAVGIASLRCLPILNRSNSQDLTVKQR